MPVTVPIRLLTPEEVPSADRGWAERALIQPLNRMLDPLRQLLDRGVSIGANLNAQVIALTLTGPENGTAIDWTAPTLTNGWANWDATVFHGAKYRRLDDGTVMLRGLIKDGTVATDSTGYAFTLPSGCRPSLYCILVTASSAVSGELRIGADGGVAVSPPSDNDYVSLEGVAFRADDFSADWSAHRIDVRSTLKSRCAGIVPLSGEQLDAAGKVSAQVPLATPAWLERSSGGESILRLLHQPGLYSGVKYRLTYLALGE